MALADNATVKADLEWNAEEMEGVAEDFGIDMDEWIAEEFNVSDDTDTDIAAPDNFKYDTQYGVIVMCSGEREQEDVYERLTGEGFSCKVVSV